MKILFFDTETSGLPLWQSPSDAPGQPWVVELAAKLVDSDNGDVLAALDTLINPFGIDAGFDMPAEVLAIHGITNDMLRESGCDARLAWQGWLDLYEQADEISCFGSRFDLRLMRIFAAKLGYEKWENTLPVRDVMTLATKPAGILKANPKHDEDFKFPKLSEAYEALCGGSFVQVHRAGSDLDATVAVAKAIGLLPAAALL